MAYTPDGRPLSRAVCTCTTHCPSGPYHERACCAVVWCDCWHHAEEYERRAAAPPPQPGSGGER